MATHSSILAGIVPWREEPGRFQESDTVYRPNHHHHHHRDLVIQMHSEARSTAVNQGLPRWLSGKESACQCKKLKRCRLDPWVGKIPWRRKWHLNSGFLPGKSYEQGLQGLQGYSPWGRKESDTTEHAHMLSIRLTGHKHGKDLKTIFNSLILQMSKYTGALQ